MSALGRQWRMVTSDARLALAISQRYSIPIVAAQILAGRGISLDDAGSFLAPRLREAMPDPYHLKDMDKAIARLVQAITSGERITIFGDYDVDGATSTALWRLYGQALGVAIGAYIPDRLTEGYGPNIPALEGLYQAGTRLLITVDCGTTAFAPLGRAHELGLEVIVIDHHISEPTLPPAVAIINPNRLDQVSPLTNLAAVGVTYLTLVALNSALDAAGFFTSQRPKPNLLRFLDIVALGTVCDVVPLTGLNRALVAQGLKVLAHRENIGLSALSDSGAIQEKPTAYHLGFVLGPRINAGGRVGRASLGSDLLCTASPVEAANLAKQLEGYNRERKLIEDTAFEEAVALLEACPLTDSMAFVAQEGWHPGIIGIVAGRLKERYQVPTIVVSLDAGTGKASCRSAGRFDMGSAVIAARQEGLLLNGGGHAMAAGFTVARDGLPRLKEFLHQRIALFQAATPLTPTLTIDGIVTGAGVTTALAEALQTLAPFGAGNPQPRLLITDVTLQAVEVFQNHVRCQLRLAERAGYIKAIAFRAMDSALGAWLLDNRGKSVAIIGTVKLDRWGGRTTVSVMIEDIDAAASVYDASNSLSAFCAAR